MTFGEDFNEMVQQECNNVRMINIAIYGMVIWGVKALVLSVVLARKKI